MRIHREGRPALTVIAIVALIVSYLVIRLTGNKFIIYPVLVAFMGLYLFFMYFYRFAERPDIRDDKAIIAPCDGKVVVIEKVVESEYFQGERLQISIFMSPLNVHMNWFPVGGKILLSKVQKGSHMVAWAPKSSTENERSTVVIETKDQEKILVRQIAGAAARRVVCYAKEGEFCEQNGNLGFIKLGSRVDVYLPVDSDVKVEINQAVVGSQTILAKFR